MKRRAFLTMALVGFETLKSQPPLFAQNHHPLPEAKSSAEPYAKLQGGTPHHLTADQAEKINLPKIQSIGSRIFAPKAIITTDQGKFYLGHVDSSIEAVRVGVEKHKVRRKKVTSRLNVVKNKLAPPFKVV
jgi:hypothetical protein